MSVQFCFDCIQASIFSLFLCAPLLFFLIKDLSLLLAGLVHADDRIRALSVSGISNLSSVILAQKKIPDQMSLRGLAASVSDLGHLFWIGFLLLHTSPNPVARKTLTSSFDELIRSARNACTAVQSNLIEDLVLDRISYSVDRSWLVDTALVPLASRQTSISCGSSGVTRQILALYWLGKLIRFVI